MSDRQTPPRKAPVRVRDVMKKKFDMIDGMATVREALEEMQHIETKMLIVKKRHEDDEYGMLQIPDIAKLVLAQDRSPDRVNVYEVMTKPVITIDSNMDIRYCARLLAHMHISRAPVMENGEVVGVVSHTDLVMKGMIRQMQDADGGV